MKKRVFIVHGWEGTPNQAWFPWIKKELEKRDFEVFAPQMPNTEEPKIEEWVPFLAKQVGEPNENSYFVGHSIGCQTIMRYLETLEDRKVGGVIFVAGFFNLPNLETEEEKEIAKPWLERKINLKKVKKAADNFVAIFSDNDSDVSLSDSEIFKQKLNAEIVVEHNRGHFSEDTGIKELPIVLDSILKLEIRN
ncbi:alpha/beta hydrolase [Patescibacteria group bacterium]|nr:alpha/beta hydrolase [Patescibacteria group bacterium]